MATLRDISVEYQEVLYQATNSEEISNELFEHIKNLNEQFDKKIENMACVINEIMTNCNSVSIEIERLTNRLAKWKNNLNTIKEYMLGEMISAQKQKIETPLFTVKIRKSEVCQVDGAFIEEAQKNNLDYLLRVIPEKIEPDKKAIKTFLSTGGALEHSRMIEKSNLNIN